MKNSLVKEFNIKSRMTNQLNDYDIFRDKKLLEDLKNKIVENILDSTNYKKAIEKDIIITEVDKVIKNENLSNLERNHLYNLVDNEINGFGPLTEVLNDPAVSTIMVNSPKDTFISGDFPLRKDDSISFINDEDIIKTIKKLIEPNGLVIDKNHPIISTRIANNASLEAVIPPLSNSPILTIKKYNEKLSSIEELIRLGTLTIEMARFLEACIKANLNILVCGNANSGKSMLLHTLTNLIADEKRIVYVLENDEIEIHKSNLIKLYNNITNEPLNMATKLLANRIVIDEMNENNSFSILNIMSKEKGIITSTTGLSPTDAITNIKNMVSIKNPDLKDSIPELYIYKSIDIIITISSLNDSKKKITNISELVPNNEEFSLQEIFTYVNDQENSGEFKQTNSIPLSYKKIKDNKIDTIDDLFNK